MSLFKETQLHTWLKPPRDRVAQPSSSPDPSAQLCSPVAALQWSLSTHLSTTCLCVCVCVVCGCLPKNSSTQLLSALTNSNVQAECLKTQFLTAEMSGKTQGRTAALCSMKKGSHLNLLTAHEPVKARCDTHQTLRSIMFTHSDITLHH